MAILDTFNDNDMRALAEVIRLLRMGYKLSDMPEPIRDAATKLIEATNGA